MKPMKLEEEKKMKEMDDFFLRIEKGELIDANFSEKEIKKYKKWKKLKKMFK